MIFSKSSTANAPSARKPKVYTVTLGWHETSRWTTTIKLVKSVAFFAGFVTIGLLAATLIAGFLQRLLGI